MNYAWLEQCNLIFALHRLFIGLKNLPTKKKKKKEKKIYSLFEGTCNFLYIVFPLL